MIRCGVYLRQSQDDDDDRLAVTRQWDEIVSKICTPRDWEPVRYCDNDSTAVGPKRKLPERDRMLRDVEAGELQAIAALDCDRLYREPIDLEYIIPLADKYGIMLATVTGDVDLSTDNGRLFARIKGAVAKAETERKSARQKLQTKQAAEAGLNWSSRRPFGRYKGGELHPIESVALASAYEQILAGHTLHSIIRGWNTMKIETTLGNPWRNGKQLSVILKNPRNAGLKSHHREILGEADWEPIVTRDVWQAVVDILNAPDRMPQNMARKHLLSTIALCGLCAEAGKQVTVKPMKTGSAKRELIYRCRECWRTVQRMDELDDYITGVVVQRLSRPDAAELLVDQSHPDLDAKRLESKVLRARLQSLAVDFADGDLDKDQLRAATARLKTKIKAIDQVVEDANRARLFKGVVGEDAVRFPGLPLERRRAIIQGLMTITLMDRSLLARFDPATSLVIEWHPMVDLDYR